MKLIIVLDKICLMSVIAISVCAGYKAGVVATEVKFAKETIRKADSTEEG